jgi:hypothetical protein
MRSAFLSQLVADGLDYFDCESAPELDLNGFVFGGVEAVMVLRLCRMENEAALGTKNLGREDPRQRGLGGGLLGPLGVDGGPAVPKRSSAACQDACSPKLFI